MNIHPTAIISSEAVLADDIVIGPFSIVEGPVEIASGGIVGPHVHLMGPLVIGQNNRFHTGCVIGDAPQHLGYKGERTQIFIGDRNTFREGVTVHRGMPVGSGRGKTIIGNDNFFMANSHIAHDCIIGSNCVLANGALIGGHTELADRVVISGNAGVHQQCRVGKCALLGGTAALTQDLPPFWIIQGGVNVVHGVNMIGMRRAGYSSEEIQAIRQGFKYLNRSQMTIPEALERLEKEHGELPAVQTLIEFIRTTKRGITVRRGRDENDLTG